MLFLDSTAFFSNVDWGTVTSFGAVLVSMVGGYVMIRERILKSELKIDATMVYVDKKNEMLDIRIEEMKGDIAEFKQLNKETNNSLVENTAAIRELRVVLDLLKEQLGLKAMRRIRKNGSE